MVDHAHVLILHPSDNVGVALSELSSGTRVDARGVAFQVRDRVPKGHKIALRRIRGNADVLRYGEVIGRATAEISQGAHVHTHNLVSRRLPGPIESP